MNENTSPTFRLREASYEELRKIASAGHLYAVIDACLVPSVPKRALELTGNDAVSLYRGGAQERFWEVAPYLMRVRDDILPWIMESASADGWGIVIATKEDLATLERHLRHFLKVQSSGGDLWLFRFYDPRVLAFFLPTCTGLELLAFYGPVAAFGALDPGHSKVAFWAKPNLPFSGSDQQLWQSLGWGLNPRLRPEQEKAFEKYADEVFAKDTVLYVKGEHTEKIRDLTDQEIENRVKVGIAKARSYGLKSEDSILYFVALMFDIAPNFDEQPGIRRALFLEGSSPDARMDELLENTSEDDWDQAEENYDERKWQDAGAN